MERAEVTEKLIKVFGERNTGTRAVIRMIRAAPHVEMQLSGIKRSDDHLAKSRRIKDRFKGHWLHKYQSALATDTKAKFGDLAGWKHTAPKFSDAFVQHDASVLFAVKNPYSWLISLAKRPYHTIGRDCFSLEQFIDYPWLTIPRDQTSNILVSPMHLWNEKLRAYHQFEKESTVPTARVIFEDFVQKPVQVLSQCLRQVGANPAGLKKIKHSTKEPKRSVAEIQKSYSNRIADHFCLANRLS